MKSDSKEKSNRSTEDFANLLAELFVKQIKLENKIKTNKKHEKYEKRKTNYNK